MLCPECGSNKLIRFGKRWGKTKRTDEKRTLLQQYQCKHCGRITLKPRGT